MNDDQPELAAWLADLEAEQATRALVIASVRQRLGLEPATTSIGAVAGMPPRPSHEASSGGPIRSDSFFRLTIPEAIKKYLAMVKRPQSPKDIADALQRGGVLSQAANFYPNITTALKRLKVAGDVVNTKEGWGLSEWYPNKPKQAEIVTPKKRRKGSAPTRAKPKQRSAPKQQSSRAHESAPTPAITAEMEQAVNWHQFMGAAAKAGRTMPQAAAEWKARKAANG